MATHNSIMDEFVAANSAHEPLRVMEVDFRADARWLAFVSSHPDALIYHHPGWLSALESEHGRKCIALACENSKGEFEAILPLISTRGLPLRLTRSRSGRRLSSLPRTPLTGPLATNDRAMKAVLEAAVQRAQQEPDTQLEIKTTIGGLDGLVPDLCCVPWRDTFMRSLPHKELSENDGHTEGKRETRLCPSCEACRLLSFGNSRDNHQIKWAVNKAIKQGVSVRQAQSESDLKEWYKLYLQVMRRNVVPPRPFRFFQRLWSEFGTTDHLALYLAEQTDWGNTANASTDAETPASEDHFTSNGLGSGSILLQFGKTSFWAFTGSDESAFRLHANDLVLLHCMRESCRQGFHAFDLGEVAEEHPELIQFKLKWGTSPKPMYRYYYPAPATDGESAHVEHDAEPGVARRMANSVWQHLPLNVIAFLGDWIYSYL